MSGYDRKKVVWGVIYDHVVKDPKDNDDIGLRGFYLIVFGEYKGGGG